MHTGRAVAAAPLERGHRPDHPGRLPQAGHPHRASRTGCSPPGATIPTSCSTAPSRRARRCWSPARTSAPGRPGSTPSGPCATTVSGWSCPRSSPTSSAATPARAGWSTACVAQPDVERLWSALEAEPATEVTVDLNARTVSWGLGVGALRHRRLHPMAADGGSGRRRPDPASTPTRWPLSRPAGRPGCRRRSDRRPLRQARRADEVPCDTTGNAAVGICLSRCMRIASPPNRVTARHPNPQGETREQGSADRPAVRAARQQEGRDRCRRGCRRHHHSRRGVG